VNILQNEGSALAEHALSQLSSNDQIIVAYRIKYADALFEAGMAVPRIQASWRIAQNLLN